MPVGTFYPYPAGFSPIRLPRFAPLKNRPDPKFLVTPPKEPEPVIPPEEEKMSFIEMLTEAKSPYLAEEQPKPAPPPPALPSAEQYQNTMDALYREARQRMGVPLGLMEPDPNCGTIPAKPKSRVDGRDCNNYFGSYVFNPENRSQYVGYALAQLEHLDFDAIVVRGVSGLLMGAILADRLARELIVVRKDAEASHSWSRVEGAHGPFKYIIVDDFMDSGNTLTVVIKEMREHRRQAVCIGVYLYAQEPSDYKIKRFNEEIQPLIPGARLLNNLPDPEPVPTKYQNPAITYSRPSM